MVSKRDHYLGGSAMKTYRWLGLATAVVVALFGFSGLGGLYGQQGGEHHGHFMTCAKACSDCALQCDSCYHHCMHKVVEGNKDHAKSMRLCVDCAEFCRLSATLCARDSHLAVFACEGCAKSCDECATSCESFKDDKHMAACAKSCRDCAQACREMVKMVKK
jgi:hypothetical protein